MEVVDGNIDSKWIVDPLNIGYLEGYGIDKEIQNKLIKELYSKCGMGKMGVAHNDLLKQQIEDIVNE